jgi:hypothetical protein
VRLGWVNDMARRLEKRTETFTETDYDYEGNPFDYKIQVEVLSVFEDGDLVWEGSLSQANSPCPHASFKGPLPWQRDPTPSSTRTDALWGLVAPLAEEVHGEPDMYHERQIASAFEIGSSKAAEHVPTLTHSYLSIRSCEDVLPEEAEWLLVQGEEKRYLVHQCYLTGSPTDAGVSTYVLGGNVFVGEPL